MGGQRLPYMDSPRAAAAGCSRPPARATLIFAPTARDGRKCRSEKIALKHPAKPSAFQSILGREIFRGGAANDLTCGSGAKTGQFEIGCPPGRGAYDDD